MEMTAATALVVLVALVPGALGSYAYQAINGLDWREKEWGAIVRNVAFSALGLAIYVLFASRFAWAPAIHVIPTTYASNFTAALLPLVAWPFIGHLLAAGVVGALLAYLARGVAILTRGSSFPCAWDEFVNSYVTGRWTVVTLKSGDVYAGYIAIADSNVASDERDLVLREPARYDAAQHTYVALNYRDMFLPAELIQNMASLQLDTDRRIGPKTGEDLFKGEHDNEETNPTTTTEPSIRKP